MDAVKAAGRIVITILKKTPPKSRPLPTPALRVLSAEQGAAVQQLTAFLKGEASAPPTAPAATQQQQQQQAMAIAAAAAAASGGDFNVALRAAMQAPPFSLFHAGSGPAAMASALGRPAAPSPFPGVSVPQFAEPWQQGGFGGGPLPQPPPPPPPQPPQPHYGPLGGYPGLPGGGFPQPPARSSFAHAPPPPQQPPQQPPPPSSYNPFAPAGPEAYAYGGPPPRPPPMSASPAYGAPPPSGLQWQPPPPGGTPGGPPMQPPHGTASPNKGYYRYF